MLIAIFDTETTSLEKPFCYNIGYLIYDTILKSVVLAKEFVIEQVWHNPMLFTTAYYSDKRPIYISRLRSRQIKMNKFGYVCQEMIRDFKAYNVEKAFAFNSDFDEKVFDFNCDWFKCNNPFDNIEIKDIRAYAHNFLVNDDYKQFCENNNEFTDSGNYSTTAETMFRYITNNIEFNEQHTALNDSEIECKILEKCLERGADLNGDYKALKSIERVVPKLFQVKYNNQIVYSQQVQNITYRKTNHTIILK